MKKRNKQLAVLALSVMMATATMTGCTGYKNTDAVATVGDEQISAGVANFYARFQQGMFEANMSAMLGENMWSQEVSKGVTYEDNMKESLMNSLQQLYILEDHMKDYDVTVTEEEKKAITEAAEKFDKANKEDAKKLISGEKEYVERFLTLATIQNKMTKAITADVSTEVADEEAAQKSMLYVKFPYVSMTEDGKQVTLTDEEKAALKEKAAAFANGAITAADFEAYATEQGQKAEKMTFDAKSTAPAKEVVEAANALAEGAVTDLIETEQGLFVAKVTSLLDREATDAKKAEIVNQRKSDKFTEVFEGWKKDTKISVNKKVWEKIDFEHVKINLKQTEKEAEQK